MPITQKGKKIIAAMRKKYGDKKGESVFYASANKGTITGVHKGGKKHNPIAKAMVKNYRKKKAG